MKKLLYILAFFLAFTGITHAALTDNLVSYWALDGDTTDSVGGNDGSSWSGWTTGKIGSAAAFTGSGNFSFPVTGLSTGNGHRTVNMWIKAADNTDYQSLFIYGGLSDTNAWSLSYSGVLRCSIYVYGCQTFANTGMDSGTWYMVTWAWDGSTMRYYLNGFPDGTSIMNGTPDTTAVTGYMGGNTWFNDYNGDIDEVGFWSRTLSGTEITALYNGGSGLTYPFSAPPEPPTPPPATGTFRNGNVIFMLYTSIGLFLVQLFAVLCIFYLILVLIGYPIREIIRRIRGLIRKA